MTQLLIQGEIILAADVVDEGEQISSVDAIYPKHVLEGWQVIDVDLPGEFSPVTHRYINGAVVRWKTDQERSDEVRLHNLPLLQAIEAIERDRQPRAQRDAILLNDTTRLQAIDAEIAALRAQLIK